MAKLTWFRVDCDIRNNPKISEILRQYSGESALILFLFSIGYTTAEGTGGFIPAGMLRALHGTNARARLLVEFGFWEVVPGGWDVHDYADYQPLDAAAKARSQKAKAAAEARWGKRNAQVLDGPWKTS
jgi:hypothetical protein